MRLKLTILGCGNSSGVPAVGNYWGDCDPNEPKNRRFKCCLAVQSEDTTIIIDTGADFRSQMNMFNITSLDCVFYTHHHGDHTNGIDDIRSFYFRGGRSIIPCMGGQFSLSEISDRFSYLFDGGNHSYFYPSILDPKPFTDNQYGKEQQFNDISFIPFEMDHGTCISMGYRFGDVSYCVDMKRLDDKALNIIKGSRIWIVDGAGYNNPDNDVHSDLETIFEYNKIIGADQVYISSLSTLMDYQTLLKDLPEGFLPAHDGLVIDIKK